MDRINNICKDFNSILDELNFVFLDEERFNNPFNSNCILRITKDKIAFADIDKLCEYFGFFNSYKNFEDITQNEKKNINLYEINEKNMDIYNYIKIVYDNKTFIDNFFMKIECIGDYIYLSDLLSLKYEYKITLYEYIIKNINKYKEMKFDCLINSSLWNDLIEYIINNCSNDKKIINLICYWRNFMNNDTTILIRNIIMKKFKSYKIFEIYDIYKDCFLFNIDDDNDLMVFNFIPFEIFLFKTNINIIYNNKKTVEIKIQSEM